MEFYAKHLNVVSTHSRRKAAGRVKKKSLKFMDVSTHSRLKAAGTTGER